MAIQLHLEIAATAGIQLNVIQAMKKLGLRCHHLESVSPYNGTRNLRIEFDGGNISYQEIYDAIKPISGVLSVTSEPLKSEH